MPFCLTYLLHDQFNAYFLWLEIFTFIFLTNFWIWELRPVCPIGVLLEYPTTTDFQWEHLKNGPYTYTVEEMVGYKAKMGGKLWPVCNLVHKIFQLIRKLVKSISKLIGYQSDFNLYFGVVSV